MKALQSGLRNTALVAVIAGLVHLGAVLLLAARPGADDERMASLTRGQPFVTVAGRPAPYADPAMATALCPFDLRDGPVEVSLPVDPLDYAGLSVHGPRGETLYALPNGAAVRGALALVLVPQGLATGDDEAVPDVPRVPLAVRRGFVMVEALAALPSARAQAEARAGALTCRRAAR